MGLRGVCILLSAVSLAMLAACSQPRQEPYPVENIVYTETGSMMPVPFSHRSHLAKGAACQDCHPVIFEMRQGMADATKRLNMKTIYEGDYCGVCHNGKKAFGLEKCSGCHLGGHM
ncbi:MAG: hypothetical protein OEV28_11640 [Nitrospirota bacterium]|nr:hypothetical protein [Nitrospirota bacterium]